jgi:hypothetical protein
MLFQPRPTAASARIARCALAVALGCGGGVCSWGQELSQTNTTANPAEVFAIEAWTIERGMPQNSVTAVLQTHRGYI